MAKWTFYDYVEEGANQIEQWLNEEVTKSHQKAVRSALRAKLEKQQLSVRLERPHFGDLHGVCEGLFEIILKYKTVQYRPLACYGLNQGEVIILIGAKEQSDRFVPRNACDKALERKALVRSEEGRGYTELHDYIQTASIP